MIKEHLRKNFKDLSEWFFENYMVLNQKKYYYICTGRYTENGKFEFDHLCLANSKEEVVLGVTIDEK